MSGVTLKAAVIGTGFIGPHHIEAIRRTGLGEVVAIVGSDGARTDACARRLRVPRASTDLMDVLSDPEIDVVHVCTRNNTHESVTLAALEAGKHVMVEKPMALDPDGADRMATLAGVKRLHLGVAFTYRGYPMVRRARELVRQQRIGMLRLVHGGYLQDWLSKPNDYNWRVDSLEAGRSRAIADIGSHWFDLLEYISGDSVSSVLAETRIALASRDRPIGDVATYKTSKGPSVNIAVDTEDEAIVTLRLSSGAVASCVLSQVSPGRKNHLTIELAGSTGTLSWNLEDDADRLWLGHRDSVETLSRVASDAACTLGPDPAPEGVAEGWPGALRDLLCPFYALIAEGAEPSVLSHVQPYPTEYAGRRALAFVDAALSSAATGHWTNVAVPSAITPGPSMTTRKLA